MELLLLGLAGLGGLALLLQQKPLPTREDAEKAFITLEKNPDDAGANTVMGKFLAFVQGKYDEAMPFLAKGNDAALKSIAEKEPDKSWLAVANQRAALADEWVAAAKKTPALSRIYYDRAAHHYTLAWPNLEGKEKERVRLQGRRLAASRPPGPARKGVPSQWHSEPGIAGKPSVWDGAVARTGSYSIKIPPPGENLQNAHSSIASDLAVIPPDSVTYELSGYTLGDGTESSTDQIAIRFFGPTGNLVVNPISTLVPNDLPFWNRAVIKGNIPEGASRAQVVGLVMSKKGSFWIDDMSLKIDNREVLKNGSFEEK